MRVSSRSSALVSVTSAAPGAPSSAGVSRSSVLPEPCGPITPAVRSHGTHNCPPRGSCPEPRRQPTVCGSKRAATMNRRWFGWRSGLIRVTFRRAREMPSSRSASAGLAMPCIRPGPQRRSPTLAVTTSRARMTRSTTRIQAVSDAGVASWPKVAVSPAAGSPPSNLGRLVNRSDRSGKRQPEPAARFAIARPR